MRKIHDTIKKHENSRLVKQMYDIGNSKNDATRMYNAIRNIYVRDKPKQPLTAGEKEITCDKNKYIKNKKQKQQQKKLQYSTD